jgi:DNA repair exonuclease SbcCD ATPase subunit
MGSHVKEAKTRSIVDVASELDDEVTSFETLTARVAKLELGSHKEILRAAELLGQAAESHKRFLEQLRSLIGAIDDVRSRQNQSAATLSAHATRLDERRMTYEQLQQRFASIGVDAHEVNALIQRAPPAETPEAREENLTRLRQARERLTASVDAARVLVADAREAQLSDLERQADALRQQLSALAKKLQHVEDAHAPGSD